MFKVFRDLEDGQIAFLITKEYIIVSTCSFKNPHFPYACRRNPDFIRDVLSLRHWKEFY